MRTLILLFSYKALPKEERFSDVFQGRSLPLDEKTYYGNSILGDCYPTLARRWLEAGLVDAVKGVVIQYPRGHPRYSEAGVISITKGFDFYILEMIEQYRSIHEPGPDDVVFVRGHPPWEPILEQHRDSFKVFYSGGFDVTKPMPRYPVDVVLVDDPSWDSPDVRCVELKKCCDEQVFRPLGLEKKYDVCLVARMDPHDLKGQLRFARLADKKWKAIFVGEIVDRGLRQELEKLWPDCTITGELTKTEVNRVLNESRVSVVMISEHESITRTISESLASGTPVMIHRAKVGRKYITPESGCAAGSFFFRWTLSSMLRNIGSFRAREEYERLLHSDKVARELWESLRVPARA